MFFLLSASKNNFPIPSFYFFFLLFISLLSPAEQEEVPGFQFTSVAVKPDIVKSGENVNIHAIFKTGVNEKASGYKIFAYVRDVPEDCKNLKWELRKAEQAKWNSYTLVPYKWFNDASEGRNVIEHTLATKNWPVGDYRINIQLVTFKDGKDFYRSKSFLLSIIE